MTENKPIIECNDCANKCSCFYNFLNFRLEQLSLKTQKCEELKFKVHDLRQLRELDREARERLVQQLDCKTQECENWKGTAKQYAKNEEYYRSQVDELKAEKDQAEQKLELIRKKVQAYINDEADLTPEQVLQIIDEVK